MASDRTLIRKSDRYQHKRQRWNRQRLTPMGQVFLALALTAFAYAAVTEVLPRIYIAFREANRLPEM